MEDRVWKCNYIISLIIEHLKIKLHFIIAITFKAICFTYVEEGVKNSFQWSIPKRHSWLRFFIKISTYGDLILNTWGIEEWLNLLPQLPPWPCAQLKISAQCTLNDCEGNTLFLQLLEDLTVKITTNPSLHPWHDTAKTFITELLHLTQDTSTEEYLFFRKSQQNF